MRLGNINLGICIYLVYFLIIICLLFEVSILTISKLPDNIQQYRLQIQGEYLTINTLLLSFQD